MSNLETVVNIATTILLAGKEWKVSQPSLKDLAEAQRFAKDRKKQKRKEKLQEIVELLGTLPQGFPQADKKELIEGIIPKEITPLEKMEILEKMPSEWDEKTKDKNLAIVLAERDSTDWDETVYVLWRCLVKHNNTLTFEDVQDMVTLKDLKKIIELINPSGGDEKNE